MSAHLLALFGNVYLLAYAVNAALRLIGQAARLSIGANLPEAWQAAVERVVVVDSLLVLPVMILTPRLPPSVFVPLALSALWLASSAAPLPLLLSPPTLDAAAIAIQLTVASLALYRLRVLSVGRGWLLDAARPTRPAFSPAHTMLGLLAAAFGAAVVVFAYLPLWFLTSIQTMTEGFVRFDLAGVSLADRLYERNDEQVRLVGMMHVGEGDAYDALVESFAGSEQSVILAEGVTDEDGLLEEEFSYAAVAQALGLDTQRSLETYFERLPVPSPRYWPDVHHADLDLRDFHPDTITWLTWTARIWGGGDPLGAFKKLYGRFAEDPQRWSVFQRDVLARRNAHLLEELDSALLHYDRVIVPWGALHLPVIERAVLEMGFQPMLRTHHPLVSWTTIAGALRREPSLSERGRSP